MFLAATMTLSNFIQNAIFGNLNNLNQSNMKTILDLLESNQYDMSSCLSNCSNQGICSFDGLTQQYICQCNTGFLGKSCQTDERPCSRSQCLNNGTCLNLNETMYECRCSSGIFYGEFCQYKKNICENTTCSQNGYCLVNEVSSYCKCFKGFSGNDCEQEDSSVKALKNFQLTSTIICIIFLSSVWVIVSSSDLLNYLDIGSEHIDMDEWRREKLHGKELIKKKKQKKIKKKIVKKDCLTTNN